MDYYFKQTFIDEPDCDRCMLSFQKMGNDGESYPHCAAIGQRPRCTEEGHRKDCPLVVMVEMPDLIYTNRIAATDNGLRYKIYKHLENDKFFIKRFNGIFEITISDDELTWNPCAPLTGGAGFIENE
ncbi:MAG: hypothetical protein RSF40_01395 [Oscillospiraceae bacterium]